MEALQEAHAAVQRGYSVAMIAEIVDAPASAVRRWARRGYLAADSADGRAWRFGFAQLRTARSLAQLLADGHSLARIDRVVDELSSEPAAGARLLAECNVCVDGNAVVVEKDAVKSECSGQLVLRFDGACDFSQEPVVPLLEEESYLDSLREEADELLVLGDLNAAERVLRSVLCSGQGVAEDHFVLAETLYRLGDLTAARERYLACLETDENHIDARLSLGGVFRELGEPGLAASAFEGVLQLDPDCSDALLQLADLRDGLDQKEEADRLWRRLAKTAPAGPWMDQVRGRLSVAESSAQLEKPAH